MPNLLRAVTVMSAALAASGAWRRSPVAKWQIYWPVPLMAFALVLAARDLVLMHGPTEADLPFSSLALGVWAGLLVTVAGAIEIRSSRRRGAEGQRLVAASLLVAVGGTLLVSQNDATGVASGLLTLLSGVLLAMVRSTARPGPALQLFWPIALLGGALTYRSPARPDALAEAAREMGIVLTQLRRAGARVVPMKAQASVPRFARGAVRSFRINGNEVQVYLVGHDDDASVEAHLFPRVWAPPTVGGVPHLHVGPHILVSCVTADPRFARQLDSIVQHLAGARRQRRSFALALSAPP